MLGMKEAKTFEEWRDKYVRVGDGEKFRAEYNKIHGVEPVRRRRRKKNEEAD
jgi:hypothetical protein